MRFAVLISFVVACSKSEGDGKLPEVKDKVALPTTGTVAPDGVRTVQIEASKEGYVPETIPGKPGEKLKLVFTRRASGGDCMAELKDPSGKLHTLPMDKPYEIAVTVPKDGEIRFACGMDMVFGKIVADKAKS